jgi:hypothetical protein
MLKEFREFILLSFTIPVSARRCAFCTAQVQPAT